MDIIRIMPPGRRPGLPMLGGGIPSMGPMIPPLISPTGTPPILPALTSRRRNNPPYNPSGLNFSPLPCLGGTGLPVGIGGYGAISPLAGFGLGAGLAGGYGGMRGMGMGGIPLHILQYLALYPEVLGSMGRGAMEAYGLLEDYFDDEFDDCDDIDDPFTLWLRQARRGRRGRRGSRY